MIKCCPAAESEMPAMRRAGEKQKNEGSDSYRKTSPQNVRFCGGVFIGKRQIVKMQSQIPFSCRSRKAVEETDDYDKIDIVSAEGRSVRKDAETAM